MPLRLVILAVSRHAILHNSGADHSHLSFGKRPGLGGGVLGHSLEQFVHITAHEGDAQKNGSFINTLIEPIPLAGEDQFFAPFFQNDSAPLQKRPAPHLYQMRNQNPSSQTLLWDQPLGLALA